MISYLIYYDILPQNGHFEYGYPHSNAFVTFSFKNAVRLNYIVPTGSCQCPKLAFS